MLKLNCSYSRKGPGDEQFSSRQYHAGIEVELSDALTAEQLDEKVHGTFERLRQAVEGEINGKVKTVQTVDIPENATPTVPFNGNKASEPGKPWKCSDKQKNLILRLVEEHDLDWDQLNTLAAKRFGHGVIALNKLESSGFIDELFDRCRHDGNGGKKQSRTVMRRAA